MPKKKLQCWTKEDSKGEQYTTCTGTQKKKTKSKRKKRVWVSGYANLLALSGGRSANQFTTLAEALKAAKENPGKVGGITRWKKYGRDPPIFELRKGKEVLQVVPHNVAKYAKREQMTMIL